MTNVNPEIPGGRGGDRRLSVEAAQISALFNSFAAFATEALGASYFGLEESDYEYFPESRERRELVKTGNAIAKYAKKNSIATVCFLDRSARPAYIALKECWNALYPNEEAPSVRFINPKGCISLEDVEMGRYTPKWLQAEDECKQGIVEDIENIRPEDKIVKELQEKMRDNPNKNNSVLVFDTCLHTGITMGTVVDKLLRAGVTNLHTGAITSWDYDGDLPIDLFVMNRTPARGCYPFEADEMTHKTYGSVTSSANDDPVSRYDSMDLRAEIRRAVREELHV